MNARDYYNEFDPYAAQWLRNLIAEGLIPPGYVDERSIVDVRPDDLRGFRRCHFFAGLGGWPFALAVSGWPEDWRVWTGSCPCQPFSISGKRKGFADERHLWPVFRGLIEVGRPPVLFGEQVARAPEWLNLVRGDLVEMGYAVGAIPMEAASADADHFRDRYWFVADRDAGQREHADQPICPGRDAIGYDGHGDVAHVPSKRRREGQQDPSDSAGPPSNMADRTSGGNCSLVDRPGFGWGEGWTEHEFWSRGFSTAVASIDGCQYLECPDGKWRRLPPPGVRWLGARIPARVDKLRAIGNAIDHRPAAQFIGAYLDARGR
ncbi:DNA cytosine methyltransferase [Roseixanthobacter pseudopolyaromaticivorans]|uniref:DNA cytosine methyltransferase n=1 Tax=Xanthobacteraceae TaxID=335928 RepID=UPI00372C2C69